MANFFKSLMNFLPSVRAQEEEEPVDPQNTLREQCREKPNIKPQWEKYVACNERVNSKSQTAETCVEELWDYLHLVDHCVQHDLFKHLK